MKTSNVRKLFGIGGGYTRGITIPKEIWEKLGWSVGEHVVLEIDGDKLVIRQLT